jgi:hypothetical protein
MAMVHLDVPVGADDEQAVAFELACQVLEEQQGWFVGPVQILEAEKKAKVIVDAREAEKQVRNGLEEAVAVGFRAEGGLDPGVGLKPAQLGY